MRFARAQRRREGREAVRSQKERLPAFIDLIQWVKMRSRLSTRRAINVILAGSLKADSHTIGVRKVQLIDGTQKRVLVRCVPADLRGRIEIVTPEWLNE